MKKILLICSIFIRTLANSQSGCDTSAILQDLIYREFSGSQLNYKFLDTENYLRCKNVDTLNKLIVFVLNLGSKEEYFNASVLQYIKRQNYYQQAVKLNRKDSSNITRLMDSLYNQAFKTEVIKQKSQISFTSFTLKLAGYLNLKESIPVLKNTLNKNVNYDLDVLNQTLAKLGDSSAENVICNNLKTEKNLEKIRDYRSVLDYVLTQKIIYTYALFLRNNNKVSYYSDDTDYPINTIVLVELYRYVKNQQFKDYILKEIIEKSRTYKEYKIMDKNLTPEKCHLSNKMINKNHIKFMMNWFEKNKGKYIYS